MRCIHEPDETLVVIRAIVATVLEVRHPQLAEQIVLEGEQWNRHIAVLCANVDRVHRLGNDDEVLTLCRINGRGLVRTGNHEAERAQELHRVLIILAPGLQLRDALWVRSFRSPRLLELDLVVDVENLLAARSIWVDRRGPRCRWPSNDHQRKKSAQLETESLDVHLVISPSRPFP